MHFLPRFRLASAASKGALELKWYRGKERDRAGSEGRATAKPGSLLMRPQGPWLL